MARRNSLLKYFAHGLVWSIAFSFVLLTWIFVLVGLIFTGLMLDQWSKGSTTLRP